MIRAFGVPISNPEIARALPGGLRRQPSIEWADLPVVCFQPLVIATAGAAIVAVWIPRVTVLVIVPPVAVAVRPVSAPGSDGCRADCMHIIARGGLIGDFYLIGA
jgi:hypothetical protein